MTTRPERLLPPAGRPFSIPGRGARPFGLLILLACGTGGALSGQSRPDLDVAQTIEAGHAAWARGARDSAYVCYRAAFARERNVATPVLFRLASLESELNRFDPAISLLREYVRREPADDEGRLALARTLAWRRRYDEAIGVYDSVLTRDSTYRDAALGRAQALAWASRLPAAVSAYERWLRYAPGDTAAELGLARTLAWAGRLNESEERYATVAGRVESADAERGLARVVGWRGDLTRSEQLWRALTERRPSDSESWIGLAQVQRWGGRALAAESSLRRALELAPASTEAHDAMQEVRAELAGATEPSATRSEDSDGNLMNSYAVTVAAPPRGDARFRLTASRREARFAGITGASTGLRGGVSWSLPGARWSTTLEGGATYLTSEGGTRGSTSHTRPWAVTRLAGRFSQRVSAGLTYAAVPFDETATLIGAGIHTRGLEGDLSLALPHGVSVESGGGWTAVAGGTVPNARRAVGTTARWTMRPTFSAAVAVRGMRYDTTGRTDGYFAPHRFLLAEGSVRQRFGRNRGWGAIVEAGMGRQQIQFGPGDATRGNLAARGSLTVRFAPLPGYEVEGVGGASSVASPFAQGASEYSVTWFSLRGRIRAF
jgi:tetratricopeptide (TPR) repeat protein